MGMSVINIMDKLNNYYYNNMIYLVDSKNINLWSDWIAKWVISQQKRIRY